MLIAQRSESLLRLGGADEPDRAADDRSRPRGAVEDQLKQVEQGGRGVSDRDHGASKPRLPQGDGRGGARRAPRTGQFGHARVAEQAQDGIVGRQPAAGHPRGDHGGVAQDRRARRERRPGRRHQPRLVLVVARALPRAHRRQRAAERPQIAEPLGHLVADERRGLDVEAQKYDIASGGTADPRTDTYLTSATSGAGASKIGIAGSLALNLIDTESLAEIASNASVGITGHGAVTLATDDQTSMTAQALPFAPDPSDPDTPPSGGQVGIGASVALNIIANRSIAEIEDNAVLTGAGALSLSANAADAIDTEARAGAAGGVALTPAVALTMADDTTTAQLGLLTGVHVLEMLDRFLTDLAHMREAIREGDGESLFDLFSRTRAIRRGIIELGQDDARPDFGRADHG